MPLKPCLHKTCVTLSGFQIEVLKTLAKIEVNLADLAKRVEKNGRAISKLSSCAQQETTNELPETVRFPLQNMQEINTINDELKNQEIRKAVVN